MGWKTAVGPCVLVTLLWWRCGGECPNDIAVRAQQCLTNLTWGIAPSDDDDNGYNDIHGFAADSFVARGTHHNSESGSELGSDSRSRSEMVVGVSAVSLDYRKIREYCAEDGHMLRFVHCVEELSLRCPDLPPDGVFGHLINPQLVHTAIPNLCSHEDEIEEKSECMNSVIQEGNTCTASASSIILNTGSLPRSAAANNSSGTASFFAQCRYFSVLAQCQRRAISETCGGGNLGNLHASFLLTFVPSLCDLDTVPDLLQGHGDKKQNGRLGGPGKDLDTSKKNDFQNLGPAGKDRMKTGIMEGTRKGIQSNDGHQSRTKAMGSIHFQATTGTASNPQQTTPSTLTTPSFKMPASVNNPSTSPETTSAQEVTSTQETTSTQEVTSTPEMTSARVVTSEGATPCRNSSLSYSTPGLSQASDVTSVSYREDLLVIWSVVVAIVLILSF